MQRLRQADLEILEIEHAQFGHHRLVLRVAVIMLRGAAGSPPLRTGEVQIQPGTNTETCPSTGERSMRQEARRGRSLAREIHAPPCPARSATLRPVVARVAALNLGYFGIEIAVALAIGSVALIADSLDFLEDAAINLLIFAGIGWSLRNRARLGMAMAAILMLPALATAYAAWQKFSDLAPPEPVALTLTGLGALAVNLTCAAMLARHRDGGGSLTRAAFLSARNDAYANLAIIAAGLVTALTLSAWPDLVAAAGIAVLNADSAGDILRAARAEWRAAKVAETAGAHLTMRLFPISDLHLERRRPDLIPRPARAFDVLVCAGDLHEGHPERGLAALLDLRRDRPIVLVPGNHEHYAPTGDGRTAPELIAALEAEVARINAGGSPASTCSRAARPPCSTASASSARPCGATGRSPAAGSTRTAPDAPGRSGRPCGRPDDRPGHRLAGVSAARSATATARPGRPPTRWRRIAGERPADRRPRAPHPARPSASPIIRRARCAADAFRDVARRALVDAGLLRHHRPRRPARGGPPRPLGLGPFPCRPRPEDRPHPLGGEPGGGAGLLRRSHSHDRLRPDGRRWRTCRARKRRSSPMNAFIAVVLVCANGIPIEACTDDKASEVRKVRVANELGCTNGWQEIIARTDLRDEVGKTSYLKTECRRVKQAD